MPAHSPRSRRFVFVSLMMIYYYLITIRKLTHVAMHDMYVSHIKNNNTEINPATLVMRYY